MEMPRRENLSRSLNEFAFYEDGIENRENVKSQLRIGTRLKI